jgi:hypothetical protein
MNPDATESQGMKAFTLNGLLSLQLLTDIQQSNADKDSKKINMKGGYFVLL